MNNREEMTMLKFSNDSKKLLLRPDSNWKYKSFNISISVITGYSRFIFKTGLSFKGLSIKRIKRSTSKHIDYSHLFYNKILIISKQKKWTNIWRGILIFSFL